MASKKRFIEGHIFDAYRTFAGLDLDNPIY